MEEPDRSNYDELVRTTGEWWIDPWWFRKDWHEVIPRSEAQVVEALSYLKKIFPADWVRGFKGNLIENNFLRAAIYDRSAFQRAHLILLSERIRRLQNVKGINRVLDGLRGRQESNAADMELEFGDFFFQRGLEVQFPIPKSSKGKTPDLKIGAGHDCLSVECKQLKVGKLTAFIQNAYTEASLKLNDLAHARGLGWHLQFSDDTLADLWTLYTSHGNRSELIGRWGHRIGEQLDFAVRRAVWPVFIQMNGLGQGFFYPSADGTGSTTECPDVPDQLLFRRLLTNALLPAAEQLANDPLPGLIAISVREVPGDAYLSRAVNEFFELNKEKYGNVVAVLVIPWQPWFYEDPPRLILNRSARVNWGPGIDAVVQKLGGRRI